tara:strand:- start:14 stop:1162 length:1149 start_codon:yes stop_codon:yes gene_type:complete
MASKKYAYYKKGNKIAVVEQGFGGSSGRLAVAHCTLSGYGNKTDCEAAGGQWIPGSSGSLDSFGEYTSPTESVEGGLEIEYSYSPTYNNFAQPNININKFYINGWTVIGGYLTFLRGEENLNVTNWTSSPYSAVTSGSAGGNNDYILVKGSQRWNGIHRVQTAGTEGQLVTYTRVNETLPYFEDRDINFNTDEEIYDGGSLSIPQVRLANHFNVGDYIWTSGVDHVTAKTTNNGLFRVSSTTIANAHADSKLKVDLKYNTPKPSSSASSEGIEDEIITDVANAATGLLASSNDTTINIYKAYRDYAHILTDITVLQDESFELDLTHEQSLAVVYYIRGRMMEDIGNLEQREYYMRLFRRTLEKDNSAGKVGPHIMQSHWNLS